MIVVDSSALIAILDVLGRNVVTIPAKDWEAFEHWMRSPPEPNPALDKLAGLTPTWKR